MDPVVGNVRDPQAFNAFAYARGNPTSFVDSDGENAYVIAIIAVAFVSFSVGVYSLYSRVADTMQDGIAATKNRDEKCDDLGARGCEAAWARHERATKRVLKTEVTNTFISILTSAMLARDEAPGWPSPFA